MNIIKHYISIRQAFNEKKHTLRGRAFTHTHTQNNATPSPPQIILSNISLTPAVREHFPRVRSYNQTTEGDQSTRKTKLTKRSLSLSLSCSPAFPLFLLPLETKGAVPSAGHLGKCISFFIYITTRGHMIVLFFFFHWSC